MTTQTSSNIQQKEKVAIIGIEWDVVDLIESFSHLEISGFFDTNPDSHFGNFAFFGSDDSWQKVKTNNPSLKAILALDNPLLRARLFEHYGKKALVTLISPHSYISSRASVGEGSIVQRGVTIMPQAILGNGCKINVNATVHHEAKIGNFCTLAPGAQILGRVVLEDEVYIGAGAIIRQRCRIGKGSVVGAGAVVVRDIPPGITVVGVPAKDKALT